MEKTGISTSLVSWCTSQLPAQTTQHEIEGDHKEEGEIEFSDHIGDFVYGFCLRYTFMFFIIIGHRIIG